MTLHYALEIRRHWAEELLSGRKKVELRGYPLPEAVGSSRVWLLATDGPAGQAALRDTIQPSRDRETAEIVGWARFEKDKEKVYQSAAEVEADSGEHLVCSSSDSDSSAAAAAAIYGWQEGVTEALYGWVVAEARRVGGAAAGKAPLVPGRRLLRSVYLLERSPG